MRTPSSTFRRLSTWLLAMASILPSRMLLSQTGTQHKTEVDHRQLAEAFAAKNEWRDAEKEFRIYRNQNPDSVDATIRHAESLIQVGQPFDAALELQKLLQSHPESTRALALHAVLLYDTLHDPAGAQVDLEKCTRLDPNNFAAWKSLGDLALNVSKDEQAARYYSTALQLRPRDPVTIASLAYVRARINETNQAATGFAEAVQLAHTPHDILGVEMVRGRYLLDAGSKEEAVKAFSQVLQIDPESAEALSRRAEAYAGLDQWEKAEADALAAFQRAPADKRIPLLLVRIYRHLHQNEKAEHYADTVQKLAAAEDERSAKGRKLRDDLAEVEPLLRKGQYAEAATRYENIVHLLPTFYEAYFDLGMCFSQTNQPHQAEDAFRKYLSFQPVSADGHASLGIVLLEEGRGSDAIPELKEAIEIDPSLIEARKALANEYLSQSNPDAAIATLRPAENEKDEQLLVMLAIALQRKSQYEEALSTINQALLLQPQDPQANQLKIDLLGAPHSR